MMAWNAIGDVVIGLLVDGENRHLRLKARGIVQGPDFDDKGAWPRRAAGADGGAAGTTEKAGHRPLQIAAREARRFALGETETVFRDHHDGVRVAAGDVLTFPAMAL